MNRVFSVAWELCQSSNWKITLLELQKLLYIVQLLSLGKRNEPMFNADIEAWEFGPVVPEIYHQFKRLGATPIFKEMFLPISFDFLSNEDAFFVDYVGKATSSLEAWQLVAITHRKGSAWEKAYKPGVKHIKITQEAMKEEYDTLWKTQK